MQEPLCVDDFGVSVYACRHTGVAVWADRAVVVGAHMPGVKARYVLANTPEAAQAQKACGLLFHENEASCNTCSHLDRVKSPKSADGFLYGRCKSQAPQMDASPYARRSVDGVMMFHPDDFMGMPCYSSRWVNTPINGERSESAA